MIGVVGPASAHETQTIEGYDFTFGGADEPLITGERMWLELDIVNNETGEPVTGQAETLNISVQKPGNERVALDVSEKHGEPGVYEAPVIFTEPGTYIIHVQGCIDGTKFHTHFEKEVQDHTELEYPGNESQTPDSSNESQTTQEGNESQTTDSNNESRISGGGNQFDQAGLNINYGAMTSIVGITALIGAFVWRREH